jgi:hypothetical protein
MTTINNDNQDDLFGRGTEIKEYVPCIEPPVENMDKQFFASQYMDLYREARSPYSTLHPQKIAAACKVLDSLTKVTGVVGVKSTNINNVANANGNKTIEVKFE